MRSVRAATCTCIAPNPTHVSPEEEAAIRDDVTLIAQLRPRTCLSGGLMRFESQKTPELRSRILSVASKHSIRNCQIVQIRPRCQENLRQSVSKFMRDGS